MNCKAGVEWSCSVALETPGSAFLFVRTGVKAEGKLAEQGRIHFKVGQNSDKTSP